MFAYKTFILMTTALTILFAVGISKWAIAPMIIAAGISALSSLASQGISAKNNKDAAAAREAYLEKRRQDEQNWYDRNYYADPTQRADAQRAINVISEKLKNRNRATEGRAAMGGATEEAVAQEKAASNQALADVVGSIAAEGSKRKDAIDAQHLANQQNIDAAELTMQQQEAARKSQALANAVGAAGTLAASIVGNASDSDAGSTNATTQLNDKPVQVDMNEVDKLKQKIG